MLGTTSSISHSILSVTFRNDEKGFTSKLFFIRLAGSEWNSTNTTEFQRIQESIVINNSFTTLSRIINLIKAKSEAEKASAAPPQVQVSYHDSKLTRMLQSVLTSEYRFTIFG